MSYSLFSNKFPHFSSISRELIAPTRGKYILPGTFPQITQKLLTYAIKDTVSVLYWYEKLSRNGKFFDKIFESFFITFFIYSPFCWRASAGHPKSPIPISTPPSWPQTLEPNSGYDHTWLKTPYSRPICEVKQPQA